MQSIGDPAAVGIRGLTLFQPWASAIALGLKKIETRGWKTSYRGPLAIHAARAEPFPLEGVPELPAGPYPLGALVAVCLLEDCSPALMAPSELEGRLGSYGPGRYAWCLKAVRALARPIPFRGQLGLFPIDEKTIRQIREQIGGRP